MKKNRLYEVRQLQKIAGLLKEEEGLDLDYNPFKNSNIANLAKAVAKSIKVEDGSFKKVLVKFLDDASYFASTLGEGLDIPLEPPGLLSHYIENIGEDSGDYYDTEEEMDRFEDIWHDIIMEEVHKNSEYFITPRDYVSYFDKVAAGLQR